MLQLTIENEYGQKLNFANNTNYVVTMTGLTPSTATINASKIAMKPGTKFNSSTLDERNIVLTIYPQNTVEKSRINLYKYIRLGKYIKLYLKNGLRDIWIDGRIETIEGDLYEAPQQLQVSIICFDPYFKSVMPIVTEFSTITPLFTFPFELPSTGVQMSQITQYVDRNIYNESDDKSGVIIELHATGLVLKPTIYNLTTNESFTINHEFQGGDSVILNTRVHEKSLTLIRDGITTNILNKMERGSAWFELQEGDNIFTFTASQGTENLQMKVELQPIYTGV